MITGVSLNHGGQYYFRVHKKKLANHCKNGFSNLWNYISLVLKNCPTEHFVEGPRSSVLKFDLGVDKKSLDHEVKYLARIGLDSDYYGDNHLNVQMFMLAYDQNTVAIEIPIWLEAEEYENYKDLFGTEKSLSGHIDIVRIENGLVWIWDYKPNAHREKYADTQVYFYAFMLSKRTGIPLKKFMCGYFDDKNTYVFKPSEVKFF